MNEPVVSLIIISLLSVGAALAALVFQDTRKSVLALWFCGIFSGGVSLLLGAELIAVCQWLLSTLLALVLIVYTILFGLENRPIHRAFYIVSVLTGVLFVVALALGFREESLMLIRDTNSMLSAIDVGKKVVETSYIAIFVITVTILCVVIGVGVMSRKESAE